MNEITVRSLTQSDLDPVAQVHMKAFSGRALATLGQEAVRRYYEWQLTGPHSAVALGGFHNERLVGFCFGGVFRGALTGFLHKNRRFLAWRVITHPWLVASPFFRDRIRMAWELLRYRSVSPLSLPVAQPTSFGILAIAVDPQTQGTGLGKRLMAETEKIAVEQGFCQMHLTVDVNNSQAIIFYENIGWQKSYHFDNPWCGSMVKDLVSTYE